MRKTAILALLLVSIMLFAGCLRLESPLTARPEVVIDYVDGYTKIYVGSKELKRYSQMEINIVHLSVNETNVRYITSKTNLTNFTLSITVIDDDSIYSYECLIEIVAEQDVIMIIKEYDMSGEIKETQIQKTDLPVRRIMVKE